MKVIIYVYEGHLEKVNKFLSQKLDLPDNIRWYKQLSAIPMGAEPLFVQVQMNYDDYVAFEELFKYEQGRKEI